MNNREVKFEIGIPVFYKVPILDIKDDTQIIKEDNRIIETVSDILDNLLANAIYDVATETNKFELLPKPKLTRQVACICKINYSSEYLNEYNKILNNIYN